MSPGTTVPHPGSSHLQHHTCEDCAAGGGLDWAEAKHAVCRPAAGTTPREVLGLKPRPEASEAWGQTLRTRFHEPIAVGLALQKGPSASLTNLLCNRFEVLTSVVSADTFD